MKSKIIMLIYIVFLSTVFCINFVNYKKLKNKHLKNIVYKIRPSMAIFIFTIFIFLLMTVLMIIQGVWIYKGGTDNIASFIINGVVIVFLAFPYDNNVYITNYGVVNFKSYFFVGRLCHENPIILWSSVLDLRINKFTKDLLILEYMINNKKVSTELHVPKNEINLIVGFYEDKIKKEDE